MLELPMKPSGPAPGPPPDLAIGEGTFSLVVGDFVFRRSQDFYDRRWQRNNLSLRVGSRPSSRPRAAAEVDAARRHNVLGRTDVIGAVLRTSDAVEVGT